MFHLDLTCVTQEFKSVCLKYIYIYIYYFIITFDRQVTLFSHVAQNRK